MQVRIAQESDAVQLVDLMFEMHRISTYAEGHGHLNPDRVTTTLVRVLTTPATQCCLVAAADDGRLMGLLYGYIEDALFDQEKWFHEQVFYIREEYRSFILMRAYVNALQQWCKRRGVCRIQCGNGFTRDPRIDTLYKRLGFAPVSMTYAKRI